jgi:hypothetical protein
LKNRVFRNPEKEGPAKIRSTKKFRKILKLLFFGYGKIEKIWVAVSAGPKERILDLKVATYTCRLHTTMFRNPSPGARIGGEIDATGSARNQGYFIQSDMNESEKPLFNRHDLHY